MPKELLPATRSGQYYLPRFEPEVPEAYAIGKRLMPTISGGCTFVFRQIGEQRFQIEDLIFSYPVLEPKIVEDCHKINCTGSANFDFEKARQLEYEIVFPIEITQ